MYLFLISVSCWGCYSNIASENSTSPCWVLEAGHSRVVSVANSGAYMRDRVVLLPVRNPACRAEMVATEYDQDNKSIT